MGIDPTLSNALIAIARENGWAEPEAMQNEAAAELADDDEAGGTVHMQPLKRVAQVVTSSDVGLYFTASSTLKTAADESGLRLHIAAGNVLCARSDGRRHHLYIRSFEDDTLRTCAVVAGQPVRAQVQHGDVVTTSWFSDPPSFLCQEAGCTGLSGQERFECVKAFYYATKKVWSGFLAIVESDGLEDDGEKSSRERKNGGEEQVKRGREEDADSSLELQES